MSWSVLQSAGSGAAGNVSVTYGSNCSSGTKLIAVVTTFATTTATVKDLAGNSLTKLASVGLNNNTGADGELSLWAMDTPAGDVGIKPVLSTTTSGTAQATNIVAQEVSGLLTGNTSAMLDGSAGTNFGSLSANGNATCGAYSSAAVNEFLVACYGDDQFSSSTAGTPTGSTTYTLDPNSQQATGNENTSVAYGNSTNGAETATFGITAPSWAGGANAWGTLLVAFKLPGGGPAPSSGPPLGKQDLPYFPAVIPIMSGQRAGRSR